MVEGVVVDEIAVGGKAGVVPVFDVGTRHLVSPAIGALAVAARLDIAAVRQEFVADPVVVGDPHADKGMGGMRHGFLREGSRCECRHDTRRDGDDPGPHQCGALVERTTISLTSTSSGCSSV